MEGEGGRAIDDDKRAKQEGVARGKKGKEDRTRREGGKDRKGVE